jgi:hypothetical protein
MFYEVKGEAFKEVTGDVALGAGERDRVDRAVYLAGRRRV